LYFPLRKRGIEGDLIANQLKNNSKSPLAPLCQREGIYKKLVSFAYLWIMCLLFTANCQLSTMFSNSPFNIKNSPLDKISTIIPVHNNKKVREDEGAYYFMYSKSLIYRSFRILEKTVI